MKEPVIVNLDKIVTVKYRFPNSGIIRICISDKRPVLFSEICYISPHAPLAKAILKRKLGEEIEFRSPGGKQVVEIVRINSFVL